MGRTCCVKGCKNKYINGKAAITGRFFKFPKWKKDFGEQLDDITKRRRMAWVAAVGRTDITFNKISTRMFVCSRHFHKGQPAYEMMENDPDWVPSLYMGHTDITPTDTACSARESKEKTVQATETKATQTVKRESGHLLIKEAWSEAGESSQVKTEEGTHNAGESVQLVIKEAWSEAGESRQVNTEERTHKAGENGQLFIKEEWSEAEKSEQVNTEERTHKAGENGQLFIKEEWSEAEKSEQANTEERTHKARENGQLFIKEEWSEAEKSEQVNTEERTHKAGESGQLLIMETWSEAGESGQVKTEQGEHKAGEIVQVLIKEEWIETEKSGQEDTEDGAQVENDLRVEEAPRKKTTQRLCGKRKRRSTAQESSDSEQESDMEVSAAEGDTDTDNEHEFELEPDTFCDPTDSGEDMEETAGPPDDEWKSKNRQITWSPIPTHAEMHIPASCATPGPTEYAKAHISTVKSCFDLLMTGNIINHILKMTNRHGKRTVKDWKDLDAIDLHAYIGLQILSSIYRSHNESTNSLWDNDTGRAVFRATMSSTMFRLINSTLRFEDKQARSAHLENDKLGAFRTIWDKWVGRLSLLFNPGQDVCMGEQLVPFKGRCGFRQHMHNRPGRYGLKIWVICDVATSYAWKMQIYTGEPPGSPQEVNQGQRDILEMMKGLQGHTVTCGNFFTSYALTEELLKRNVAMVGTIRRNQPELPGQLLRWKLRAPRSSVFAFTKTHTVVAYAPKRGKNVLLLSTKHHKPVVSGVEHRKPEIITDYNRCKGVVDNLDKVVGTYSCKKRVFQWSLVLFYHMLDITVYNAFVLWTAMNPSWHQNKTFRRRLFLEELGTMLVSPQVERRTHLPRTAAAAAMVMDLRLWKAPVESEDAESNPNRRRRICDFCTSNKKKTATTCVKCLKFICKTHTLSCCLPCCP